MSLNWSIAKVHDHNGLHNTAKTKGGEPPFPEGSDEDKAGNWEWTKTECLIFRTMTIGINTITEANVEKVYERLLVASKVFGTPLIEGGEDRDLTFEEVHRRIGLGTNATRLTDAQFRKRMIDEIEANARRKASSEARKFSQEQVAV